MLLSDTEILTYLSQTLIGMGTEAITYAAGKYVLRVPIDLKIDAKFKKNLANGYFKLKKSQNVHGRRNFGQPIYKFIDPSTLKTVLSVCNRVNGFATTDLVEEPLTKQQIIDAQKNAIKK